MSVCLPLSVSVRLFCLYLCLCHFFLVSASLSVSLPPSASLCPCLSVCLSVTVLSSACVAKTANASVIKSGLDVRGPEHVHLTPPPRAKRMQKALHTSTHVKASQRCLKADQLAAAPGQSRCEMEPKLLWESPALSIILGILHRFGSADLRGPTPPLPCHFYCSFLRAKHLNCASAPCDLCSPQTVKPGKPENPHCSTPTMQLQERVKWLWLKNKGSK